ncbi:protein FAR1-RELATED SEQUENCE 2-like [Actinidia eriantha]|uniref:protein FAR1-RELATED SEQUENCE 2-like n=1 Tax=Actinidia eriantha TaxID=165200 RepID=UPI00258A133B|nr:protein FAR1-RELATED SEQUENCE 2-like [Actinidia eriantha]
MAEEDENPQTPVIPDPSPTNPRDEATSSSHHDDNGALSPEDFMDSVAVSISSQPIDNSDPAVWGALTAVSDIACKRHQGINILLTSDEHCIGRLVDDKRFQIESNAVSANHCRIYRKRGAAEDAENPSTFSTFLQDTSTNGTYLNWEKLTKTSPEAKLHHGDIISFAAPPQHELAVAFVFREVFTSNSLNDGALVKRKADEIVSERKRLKSVGVGAPEGPSLDDFQSPQRSNTELRSQLESQVLTVDTLCNENRVAFEFHESDDASTQCSKVGSEPVMDYSSEFTTHKIFKSREALLLWVREVGRRNGFFVVIKTSDAGDSYKRPRITFGCERSGYHRDTRRNKEGNSKKKLKMFGTKKCGCPFALKGQKLATDDDWALQVLCGVHNHPIAEHLVGHSYAGRLSEEETSLLVDMSKSLVRPKEILVTLKQRDALNATTMKTIYNARHRYKVVEKARRSQMQLLLDQLVQYKYIEQHRSCENSEIVTDLFWAHPVGLELLRAFPRVLIMDCTYKTNRYRLPLLEIVGVTSTEMTFSVAFAYLQHEQEDNYAWALGVLRSLMDECALPDVIVSEREMDLMNAIDSVFPTTRHLLCRWHINKDVMAKCKKSFETEDKWDKFINQWNMVVLSSTEGEYIQQLATFNKEFSTYPEALEYVTSSWLDTYKNRFVAAWTDTCMHCGNATTNRAEGSHAKLKRQLGSSQGSFESSWTKIHSLIELQHADIKSSFEKSLTIQHNLKPIEFKELWGRISASALDMILVEMKRASFVGCDVVVCGCVFRRTYGLPCAHEIADYMRDGRSIPLYVIHPHWRKLDMVPTPKSSTIDCQPELDLIAQRFNECDSTTKLQLLKKLRELVTSTDSTSLTQQKMKSKTQGRKNSKIDTSTHRDPCASELVAYGQDSRADVMAAIPEVSVKPKRRPKEKVYRTRTLKSILYVDAFPVGLRPYFRHVKDVAADGNCGFRVIGGLMGFGEEGWLQVRKDLLSELHSHADLYRQLYGTQDRVDGLTHTLSDFEVCPGYDRWMIMPDMGHLISSCYNVVLCHLSLKQCLTFLPLRSEPIPTSSRKEITIGFVNDNHFVEVFLLPGHPVPPIAANWHRHHIPCAEGWDTAYNHRIQHFQDIVGSDVVTRETIELELENGH